jgi:alkylated DNA repair dioxygenase AlkB
MIQPTLFDAPPTLPEGLVYRPDLITPAEEQALVAAFAGLPFKPFEFQGYLGKRRTVSFGLRYDHNDRSLSRAVEAPAFIEPLREKAAAFAGLKAEELQHVLVVEYEPGAPIGWHRDRPEFAEVVGVSFLAEAPFRFRRRQDKGWDRALLTLEPRSVYLIDGPARTEWEHSIPPLDALRYSVTFRRLRAA